MPSFRDRAGRPAAAEPTAASPGRGARIARLCFGLVGALVLANLLFNAAAAALGHGYPYSLFLWRPDDNFADFFSLLGSYPDGALARVADREGLHAILPRDPPSLRVTGTAAAVTNLHMMPFSTLLCQAALGLLRIVDPVALFLASAGGLVLWWGAMAARAARGRAEALPLVALGVVSYPMLFMFTRGNLHAGLTAMLLIQALLLGLARRAPVLAAVLLALAANVRPNAILFAAPLLFFYWPAKWRFGVALGVAGLATLLASYFLSTMLYPQYRLSSILTGLEAYAATYVVGDWGLAFGSSLFGALRQLAASFGLLDLGGYDPRLVTASTAAALAVLAGGVLARAAGRIDDALLLFLTATAYCLGSTVFADYHLLVFLIVPLALARAAPAAGTAGAVARGVALVASCLVLAPKNYLFGGDPGRPVSAQVLLNPLILLGAALLVLGYAAWRGERGQDERRPARAA